MCLSANGARCLVHVCFSPGDPYLTFPNAAGEISAAELQQGMMQIGEEVSPEELQAMMAVVDVDGSGSVNYDEFAPVGKIADGLKRLERSFAQEKVNREHADRKALQLGQRIDEIDAQIAAWSA